MGCAASTTTADSSATHNDNRTHQPNTNTNTTVENNTGENVNPSTQTTTNGTSYPDDNAIYGYDLYEDDAKKGGNLGEVTALTEGKPERREEEGEGGYTMNTSGLKTLYVDYRSERRKREDRVETRPSVSPGQLWQDRDFGLHEAIADSAVSNTLTWKRPSEISASPKLFTGGATRFDIGQGGAGTCWFLSTAANISERSDQIQLVIPQDAYLVGTTGYDGVFHCRFWKFGKWEDVYVDDFLPIVHGTTPWGARSATDENEFWVSLLEKGFARYHGSYKAVYGGQPGDAYLALTGGVAERIDFADNENKPARLFNRINNAINSGALITCSVPDKFDKVYGLVGSHAYSLTGTARAKGTDLFRVRNPWGNTEWTGPWSDKSPEWTGVSKDEIARVVKDDGEFWISVQDFMTYFDQTTICSLTPDFDQDGRSDSLNYVTCMYGEWDGETAAGFKQKLRNPRFLFTVPETGSEVALVVQMIQRRQDRQVDNFQVRCDLYKVLVDDGRTAALELMGEKTNSYTPETQCSFRHKVTPGTYAVVPSTNEPGMEKSFLIRIFAACPLSNLRELPRPYKMMSCDQQTSISFNGQDLALTFTKATLGQWKAGVNAGGQVSQRDTHATNPQYVITVNQPTLVAISLMQEQVEPRMPLGLRMFPTGKAPLDIDTIYKLHEQSVVNTNGANYTFVEGWYVNTAYMLQPGAYTLLLHMNEPNTEKLFTLVVKSTQPLDLKGYQTGM